MGKIFGFFGVFALLSGQAFAQAPVCERVDGATCGPAKAAWLGKALGDVTVLARSASVAIPVGSDNVGVALSDGDRVVARNGSSVIDLGPGCMAPLPQKSSALIYRLDAARVCVSVTSLTPAPAPVETLAASSGVYVVGGLALVGGGIAAAVMSGKKSENPPVSGQ